MAPKPQKKAFETAPDQGAPAASFRLPENACLAIAFVWAAALLYGRRDLPEAITTVIRMIPPAWERWTFVHPGEHLADLVCAGLLFGAAWLAGRPIFRAFHLDGVGRGEETVFSLGLGSGFLSLLGLCLGLFGFFGPAQLRWALGLVGLAAGALNLRLPIAKPRPSPAGPAQGSRSVIVVCAILLAGLVAIDFLAAMFPLVYYDSLVYHFALPKLYLLSHRMIPTPLNVYAGVPMNTEMLYAFGLAVGGEGAARLVPWGIGLTTLSAVILLARRYANLEGAMLAGVLLLSCPMFTEQTWQGLVEANWALFGLLAIYSLLAGSDEEAGPTPARVLLAGTFCGLAIGVKYNAVSLPIILATLLAIETIRRGEGGRRAFRGALALVAVSLALAAPWIVRNVWFYRNPVFPFFDELFAGAPRGIDWRSLLADAHRRDLTATFTTLSGLRDYFTNQWSGWENYNAIGVALVLMLPWLFLTRSTRRPYRHLLAALALAWVTWGLSSRMPRFFLFAVPWFSILAAGVLTSTQMSARAKRFLRVAILLGCCVDTVSILSDWYVMGGWQVVFGMRRKSVYLEGSEPFYPSPYYPAMTFINEKLPPDAKILFVWESRGYYCERPFVAASPHAPEPIAGFVAQSRDGEDLRGRLREAGITHVFFNYWEGDRKQRTPLFPDPRDLAVFQSFSSKHLRRVYDQQWPLPEPGTNPRWLQVYVIE